MRKLNVFFVGIMAVGIITFGLNNSIDSDSKQSSQAKYTTVMYADGNTG
ncbi:Phr family secreted Rap phosphatase inhibitor [Bacillus sp. AFS018417]|nr:Phr family secreted Rap phosphatase inhibitor [Bacillus sp. AFS018417]PEZ05296.1 Phr family secreted Rap phosphatase inhibitor [Bacillus sp. AFS018417]